MCNEAWVDKLHTVEAWFMPEGMFDHSPMLLQVHQMIRIGTSPVRFYKMWCSAPNFLSRVKRCMGVECSLDSNVMCHAGVELGEWIGVMKQLNKEGFSKIQSKYAKVHAHLL